MQSELIIFDCDGVLIDSELLAHQALIDALAMYDVHMTLEEAYARYLGKSEGHENADTESRYGIKLPEDFNDKRRQARKKLFEKQLQAMPGIVQLLDVLPIRKCVASGSSPERLQHSLRIVGLWDRFAPYVFSATQVKHGKPAPDLFMFAAQQMDVPPAACLVIEDSIAGVQAAKAAGMRVYGFAGGSHCGAGHAEQLRDESAEQVFSHMNDLAAALVPLAIKEVAHV